MKVTKKDLISMLQIAATHIASGTCGHCIAIRECEKYDDDIKCREIIEDVIYNKHKENGD